MLVATTLPPPFIVQSVALVVAAAAIAYVCFRLGLVPIVGFLVAGVVIGPHALGLVHDHALVDAAAEIGVMFLLFTIGIEFSLEKLAEMKRLIFAGGGLQVALPAWRRWALLVLLLRRRLAQRPLHRLPRALSARPRSCSSCSPTAARPRRRTGRSALGILIFQDLAVVVMVLLVPMLAGTAADSAAAIVWALAKAGAIIVAVLLVARRLMPVVLEQVARTCSPELFLLTVIAICFGTAFLTNLAGVSLSLGAFLAGLRGEREPLQPARARRDPAAADPLQRHLLRLGRHAARRLVPGDAPAAGRRRGHRRVLLVKVADDGRQRARARAAARRWRSPPRLMLAQVGEFSFVLERAGREIGLVAGRARRGRLADVHRRDGGADGG